MILSELMGRPVVQGGRRVGRVADLRLLVAESEIDGEDPAPMPDARVYGILVSPRSVGTFLGYERSGVSQPWPLAQFFGWRARGSFLVLWADVGELSTDGVVLRPGARRWSPSLQGSVTRRGRQRHG